VVAPSIGTRLRAAMTEQDSSYTKLIAAMRRVAAARGEALPETRSLVTTLSRWFNDHERPSEFYQGLLGGVPLLVEKRADEGLVADRRSCQ
jgi:hypothetical protein